MLTSSNSLPSIQRPVAKGLPILGNALNLFQETRAFLTEQYVKLGPVFRIKALNREFTVLAGTEANLFITREGTKYFRSKEFWEGLDDELGAERSMISMDGPDHARFRKVQQKGYTRSVLLSHLDEMIEITRREVLQWPIGERMPGLYSLQRIITEQLGVLGANFSPRDYLDDMIRFVRTTLLTRVTKQRPDFLRYTPAYRRAKKRALELAEKVLAAHGGAKTAESAQDLVDILLHLSQEDPDFLPTSDLLPAVLGPFIAGLDTVASTMAFLLYALLTHPSVLNQVTAEADALFAAGMTPQTLRNLDVIHRVALETLRMYPIAPAIQRTVTQDFEFAGHTIKAGEQVLLATTVPHYLPHLYPNPETFDIERYNDERKEHKQPGAFAPFGLGAHTCLGAGLAEVQIAVTTATIFHIVELEMSPTSYQLKIDPSPTPSPDKGFGLRVVKHRE